MHKNQVPMLKIPLTDRMFERMFSIQNVTDSNDIIVIRLC